MRNFIPKWDITPKTTTIKKNSNVVIRLQIRKDNPDEASDSFVVNDDEALRIEYTLSSNGETITEMDYELHVGTELSNLTSKRDDDTYTIYKTYTDEISSKSYLLNKPTDASTVYFFKITRRENGLWDSEQDITLQINDIRFIKYTKDKQELVNTSLGKITNNISVLKYDTSKELWVTPSLTTHQGQYCIGEIGYGSESRLFVQAFGRGREYNRTLDKNNRPNDLSPRVFIPTYEILKFDLSEIKEKDITGSRTKLVPSISNSKLNIDEVPLMYEQTNKVLVDSGLKFNNNGQILQTYVIDAEPTDVYIKVRIRSILDVYPDVKKMYQEGKRFKAYQFWIANDDTSIYNSTANVKPRHVYMLRDTSIYPYTVKTILEKGTEKLLFEEERWIDLGVYNDTDLSNGIIGQERYFRFLSNVSSNEDEISILTPSELGMIHVGEYFGHTVNVQFEVDGDDHISYMLPPEDKDLLEKYNISLSPRGYLSGTVFASDNDFNANDQIKLSFKLYAVNRKGKKVLKNFHLTIVRGFGNNYLTAYLQPSRSFERDWFGMISSSVFSETEFYLPSDERFGLQRLPRILLKENFVNPNKHFNSLEEIKIKLRSEIININTGAYLPTGKFRLTLGNYKIRSAIDNNGNVIYDVIYREVLPSGYIESVDTRPNKHYDYQFNPIIEIFGLRQNIFNAVGEDTVNLKKDPDDMENRAILVKGIENLSEDMIDTVPRYMNYPLEESDNSVYKGYIPIIPVAFVPPYKGIDLYNRLQLANQHDTLLNETFDISSVEFEHFTSVLNEKHSKTKFRINLVSSV